MPVDLSRIGLEGIETAQQTLNSMAARESIELENTIKADEHRREKELLTLDQLVLSGADTAAKGNGVPSTGVEPEQQDIAEFLELASQKYFQAGAPKRGEDFLKLSLEHRKAESLIDKQHNEAMGKRLENMSTAGQYMYELLADSNNEAELQVNLAQIPDEIAQILGPENVELLKNQPWSPEFKAFAQAKSLSVKEQADLEMEAMGIRRLEKEFDSLSSYRKGRLRIDEANLAERKRENARKAKADGPKVSTAPTPNERKTIEATISNLVELGDVPLADPSFNHAVEAIAGQTEQILLENRGLTYEQAAARAVVAADESGDFDVIKEIPVKGSLPFGLSDSTEEIRTYQRRGVTKARPLPLPDDPTKLVPGMYYKKDGKVKQYNP